MANEPCANVDYKYGPYNSVAEAFSSIPSYLRTIGLTVGVIENGSIQEYWFKSATASESDLVLKLGGGGPSEVEVTANYDENSGGSLIATVNGISIYDSPNSGSEVSVSVSQGPVTKSTQGAKVGTVDGTELYAPVVTPTLSGGVTIGEFYKVNDQRTNLYAPGITSSLENNIYTVKYGPTTSNGGYINILSVDKVNNTIKIGDDTFAFMKSSSNCLYYLSTTRDDLISTPEQLGGANSISITDISSTGIPVNAIKSVSVAIPCNCTIDKIQETINNQTVTDSFQYKGILYYLGVPYQIYGFASAGNLNNNNFKFTFK